MMASIPNMRSTPLPAPTGKSGSAETATGGFAAQLPIAQGKNACAVAPPLTETESIELVIPDVADAFETGEGEVPEGQTKAAETGEMARPQQPDEVTIPFLQTVPGPRVLPAAVGVETVPATAQEPVVHAPGTKPGRTCGTGGKPSLPLPAVVTAPQAQTDTPQTEPSRPEAPQAETRQQLETAVKELLERKQGLAKPVVAAPGGEHADEARPEAARVEARGQLQTAAAPIAIQTAAPVPASVIPTAAEQPQPALSPITSLPVVTKAEVGGTAEATRSTDLAVERQLDLARDSEWLDRLARDIARAGASDTPLRFRLHPQTLGHLQVELQQGDRGTAVRLTVETEAARQLLADAQPRLAAEARAQGVRIAETHVDLSGSGRHAPGDQRRQDETRPSTLIRTAPGPDGDAVASARSPRRAGLDRYA